MVYLDYNASTPVDQRILSAVAEATDAFANAASSHHAAGRAAADLIEEARGRVASLVGRGMQDVLFTSGASEGATLGLLGLMLGAPDRPNVVVSATEHKAIMAAAELGARLSGGEVRRIRVDTDGLVDLEMLDDRVDESVAAVVVMAANNETGVVSPIPQVARVAQLAGALCFIDATQLVGKGSFTDVTRVADLMVFSSHKMYGPKGAGALIVSRQVQKAMVPISAGGGQERGLRGGTQNTASIAGFGLAAELAAKEQMSDSVRIGRLSNDLLNALCDEPGDVQLNGGEAQRLTNTLNLRFVGADADAVMASMPDVMVSSGSACQSSVPSPSHVLLAMGLTAAEASESLRISLGRPTTREEVEVAASKIAQAVNRVRDLTADKGSRHDDA
ncbi:cysteine desulfurase family protein [Mycobacterium asiaticum]|uniref:Cysteine desulfurase n=1 Tax=Mycobacterium asiaticum TaxID=1790 RepID=A0A1A3NMV4_MYCAS|nr:cysteine desulfurase family protein [Mycobacterium asiaticum]OBK22399.1 cysteine desulfurase [Mycobacterium asiaticum]